MTEEQIMIIAFLYWEARMGAEAQGTQDGDWFWAINRIGQVGYDAAYLDLAGHSPA
jgi:hypothetical protein